MLREYFKGFGELSEPNMDLLLSSCQERQLFKRDMLIQANQTVGSIYFVTDGFLHYYTHNDFGNQITLKIISPNYCWTIMDSFFHQTPTLDECKALTDVRFCELKKPDYLKIKSENVELSNFIQNITEQILSAKTVEAKKQSSLSVEERYLELLQTQPKMVQEVPVNIIASLLGTSRETLHRIRRRLAAA
ncbi:Crp/Fnr family transcriptional regulator [Muricauda sp. 2012CJ35-5]|uniref:Crp/Fnr family transcriptional regulator n=1 Tax=Flagellimonas spongiicola TaxID=2942208 RepID=A0ABT0PPQ9_9FLAO|nr:Crp/Fnr family transcriptional regulator [Allomuricauda spongiicola]MCL6273378.1 Crp/Fnr family transcriptional regulator [Allomuricauda spongiicola]